MESVVNVDVNVDLVVVESSNKHTKNKHKLCEVCGDTFANFGKPGGRATRCNKCKNADMINVNVRRCKDCGVGATFGKAGSKRPEYCRVHAPSEYVDVRNRKCLDCAKKSPVFNRPGEKSGLYCKDCASQYADMVDVKNPQCQVSECTKQPAYGYEGTTRATHCSPHRLPGMVNLKDKPCQHALCHKLAIYGFDGLRVYCKDHKEPGMALIGKLLCDKCDKIALFNFEGEPCPVRCGDHRDEGMENIVLKKCNAPDCKKGCNFGYAGGKPEFCKLHRLPGQMDVVSPRCETCGVHATFGLPGQKPVSCAQHRPRGTVYRPSKRCLETGCNDLALWGYKLSDRLHCSLHKLDGERHFAGAPCLACHEVDVLSEKGFCFTCDPVNYQKCRLAKQREVKAWLDSAPDLATKYVYDRILAGGECLQNRPDFLFDCGTHQLVLEVDEFQHRSYPPECDFVRSVNIGQANGMPTFFLRYNPDSFVDAKGKRQDPTRKQRMTQLLLWVRRLTEPLLTTPRFFCAEYRLFFDGFRASYVEEQCITPWDDGVPPPPKRAKL